MIVPIIQIAIVMCHGSAGSMDPVLSAFAVAGIASAVAINRLPACKAFFPYPVINPRHDSNNNGCL